MNDGFLSAIGICKKAGRMSYGFDTVKDTMIKGTAYAVFTASDLSEKTKKEVKYLAEQTETAIVCTDYDMKTLGTAIGKLTGVISITDAGFAKMLLNKLSTDKEDK